MTKRERMRRAMQAAGAALAGIPALDGSMMETIFRVAGLRADKDHVLLARLASGAVAAYMAASAAQPDEG